MKLSLGDASWHHCEKLKDLDTSYSSREILESWQVRGSYGG